MTERTSLFRISVMGAPQDFSAFKAQPDIAPEEANAPVSKSGAHILSWPAWTYAAIAFAGLTFAIVAVLI